MNKQTCLSWSKLMSARSYLKDSHSECQVLWYQGKQEYPYTMYLLVIWCFRWGLPKFKVPCILKMPFRNEVYKCLLKPLMPLWILFFFFLFIEMPLYLFTLLNVFFILSEWNQNNFFYNVVMELFWWCMVKPEQKMIVSLHNAIPLFARGQKYSSKLGLI